MEAGPLPGGGRPLPARLLLDESRGAPVGDCFSTETLARWVGKQIEMLFKALLSYVSNQKPFSQRG